jgi:hypothetical protein
MSLDKFAGARFGKIMLTTENPNLADLATALREQEPKSLRMILPDGEAVPSHFHVTEVGRVQKDFIDCGGTRRTSLNGQLQLLVATDFEHRLSSEKLLKILQMSEPILGPDPLPLTVEYGQKVAVVYAVSNLEADSDTLRLQLSLPQTGCLAPDKCGLPEEESGLFTIGAGTSDYSPKSGCC